MKKLFKRLNVRKSRRKKSEGIRATLSDSNDSSIADSHKDFEQTEKTRSVFSPEGGTVASDGSNGCPLSSPFVSFVPQEIGKSLCLSRDGDDDSDGYHRYDEGDDSKFIVDYRGHFVVKDPVPDDENQKAQDSVVRKALLASKNAIKDSLKVTASATCETLDKSGNAYFGQGNIDAAAAKYEQALQIKRQVLQENSKQLAEAPDGERANILASMATSINNLTYLRQVKGESTPDETLASYETALEIKKEILGPTHLSIGKTLNNIGSVHYLQRQYHDAVENYEEARDILALNLGNDHLDVCTVTSNIGDVHYCLGQWQRAVTEYRAALQLRWKLLGPTDPKVVRLMEQIAELEMKINGDEDREDTVIGDFKGSDAGTYINDMNQLQLELEQDIKLFDSLHQDAAIDNIKDKAGVFREIRELTAPSKLILQQQSSEDGRVSPYGSDYKPSSPYQCFRPQEEKSPCKSFDFSAGGQHQPLVFGVVPGSPDRGSPVAVGVPIHQHYTPEKSGGPSQLSMLTKHVDGSVGTPARSEIPANLTTNQRYQALASVKDRLANLRARRFQQHAQQVVQQHQQGHAVQQQSHLPEQHAEVVQHAHVVEQEAKVISTGPSQSKLLKTSELLTMKQGIKNLRGSFEDVANNPQGTVTTARPMAARQQLSGASAPTPTYFTQTAQQSECA